MKGIVLGFFGLGMVYLIVMFVYYQIRTNGLFGKKQKNKKS
jgi:hypothetical protein